MIDNKIHIFIHTEPEGRGIRSAIGFQEANGFYYGWYIGYSGGGCQQENYFRLSKDFKEILIWCGDEDGLDEEEKLTDEEKRLMTQSWCRVSTFFDPNNVSWTDIDPEELNRFHKFDDCLQYESNGFLHRVLNEVSKHWSLMTWYYDTCPYCYSNNVERYGERILVVVSENEQAISIDAECKKCGKRFQVRDD